MDGNLEKELGRQGRLGGWRLWRGSLCLRHTHFAALAAAWHLQALAFGVAGTGMAGGGVADFAHGKIIT